MLFALCRSCTHIRTHIGWICSICMSPIETVEKDEVNYIFLPRSVSHSPRSPSFSLSLSPPLSLLLLLWLDPAHTHTLAIVANVMYIIKLFAISFRHFSADYSAHAYERQYSTSMNVIVSCFHFTQNNRNYPPHIHNASFMHRNALLQIGRVCVCARAVLILLDVG